MDRNDIMGRIVPIAREVFEKPELELCDSLDATQVDTWTSYAFMQLLEKVEKEFGFKFKMMELIKIRNIGTLVDVVMQH
jgi:acyl carrier protein